MPEHSRQCPSTPDNVRTLPTMSEHSRLCPNTPDYVQTLPTMSKHSRLCPNTPDYVRTLPTMSEHSRLCLNAPDYRASQSSLQLQLAPSLEHQTAAMLSILERYKWHQFSVVTSQIAGHDDFIQAVRDRVLEMTDRFKLAILNVVLVTKPHDLQELVNSESRVMLLYSTREEAIHILTAARDLFKITGENYVWVVTQSVIENLQTPYQFPVGMLASQANSPLAPMTYTMVRAWQGGVVGLSVNMEERNTLPEMADMHCVHGATGGNALTAERVHFDTSSASLLNEITTAIKVYAYGVEDFVTDPQNSNLSLNTQLSCEGLGDSRWKTGDRFFK
uniref:Receptor ligand binding region domain-containing protein n=1 Tax=Timema monikensis TaxID=170555 RepID=A0A7R9EAW3_9NEOP|nr:unnamed protein product [Timema monikensis]